MISAKALKTITPGTIMVAREDGFTFLYTVKTVTGWSGNFLNVTVATDGGLDLPLSIRPGTKCLSIVKAADPNASFESEAATVRDRAVAKYGEDRIQDIRHEQGTFLVFVGYSRRGLNDTCKRLAKGTTTVEVGWESDEGGAYYICVLPKRS